MLRLRMENLTDFAVKMQKGDRFISFDFYKGFWLLRLHPLMRDWFSFRCRNQYYCCIALPMVWSLSSWWFTQTIALFVREMRAMGSRVLGYIDDLLLTPALMGVAPTVSDFVTARTKISRLMQRLGIKLHPSKGEWEGPTCVDHLGLVVDS